MIGIDLKGLIDTLDKLGFAGLLIFILAGFQQGWWFFGRERDDLKAHLAAMTQDRDEWKARALTAMHQAERSVNAASTVLPVAPGNNAL